MKRWIQATVAILVAICIPFLAFASMVLLSGQQANQFGKQCSAHHRCFDHLHSAHSGSHKNSVGLFPPGGGGGWG
jgi:hypothetical protein